MSDEEPKNASYWKRQARMLGEENAKLRAELDARPVPAIPEGWKLVPIEPEDTQKSCGVNIIQEAIYQRDGLKSDMPEYWAARVYKAMLAAAPRPGEQG